MNKYDVRDALEQFESEYPHWRRYEIMEGFGHKKTGFRIYDNREDIYIDLRNAKQLLSELNRTLAKSALQTTNVMARDEQKESLTFQIKDAVSFVEPEYDHIEEDLRSRFGEYIHRIMISKDFNTGNPFVKFYYMGKPTRANRKEIKEYIISTYQS